MDVGPDRTKELLAELSAMLLSPQLPVQSKIADELGLDQPLVSRAANGKLRRFTPRVEKLYRYAKSRLGSVTLAAAAVSEMDAEIGSGSRRARHRRGSAGEVSPVKPARKDFEQAVLAGVKAYIADGYDPRLIAEQLAVLRRAQRVRRPGRSLREPSGQQ